MDQTLERHAPSIPLRPPGVRDIALSQPFEWLRLGARDLAREPGMSLAIGAVVAFIGALLMTAGWRATYAAPALLGGFLLVAPFFAIAVYRLSRGLESGGETPQMRRIWRSNAGSIALFGLALVLAYIVWERLAAILFALFYDGEPLQWSRLPQELLLSGRYGTLLLAYFAVGALLAAAVFALSVVTAPLLVDRPLDTVTAMLTSLRCCTRNPAPMLLWAALIAALTVVGFATAMLGLIVIFPWLAHAGWHAYRDLVAPA
jgi:uncharacterized membrane protein